MKKTAPRRITFIVIAAVLLLSVPTFLLRGWLREEVMGRVVASLYLDGVERQFAHDFTAVSKRLTALELAFAPPTEADNTKGRCGVLGYELISATFMCARGQSTGKTAPSPEYAAQWQRYSPAFEQYLLENGWKKTWNERQPIDELFRERNDVTSIGVNYVKTHGKVTCTLSIWLNPAVDDPNYGFTPAQFTASQDCTRFVAIFGGY